VSGIDYIAKRTLFAIVTVFVAITLNFVLFRSISGDAVSALRPYARNLMVTEDEDDVAAVLIALRA